MDKFHNSVIILQASAILMHEYSGHAAHQMMTSMEARLRLAGSAVSMTNLSRPEEVQAVHTNSSSGVALWYEQRNRTSSAFQQRHIVSK